MFKCIRVTAAIPKKAVTFPIIAGNNGEPYFKPKHQRRRTNTNDLACLLAMLATATEDYRQCRYGTGTRAHKPQLPEP